MTISTPNAIAVAMSNLLQRGSSIDAAQRHASLVPAILFMRMLVQKFNDGVLTEIELEALHLDLDLARCEALLGLLSCGARRQHVSVTTH